MLLVCTPVHFIRCFSPQFRNFVLDQAPLSEQVAQLAQEFYNSGIFELLVDNLHRLDFEVRASMTQKWKSGSLSKAIKSTALSFFFSFFFFLFFYIDTGNKCNAVLLHALR